MQRPRTILGLSWRLARLRRGAAVKVLGVVAAFATAVRLAGSPSGSTVEDAHALRPRPRPDHLFVSPPALAFSPGGWLVVWQRTTGAGHEIVSATIDTERWTHDEPKVIATLTSPRTVGLQALWNGARFGVAWETDDHRAYVIALAANGAPLGPPRPLPGAVQSPPVLAWSGRQWGAVWTRLEEGYDYVVSAVYAGVSAEGVPLEPVVRLNRDPGEMERPTIAWLDGQFLTAWGHRTWHEAYDLSFQPLSPAGELGALRTTTLEPFVAGGLAWTFDDSSIDLVVGDARQYGNPRPVWFGRFQSARDVVSPRPVQGPHALSFCAATRASLGDGSVASWSVKTSDQTYALSLALLTHDGSSLVPPVRLESVRPYTGSDAGFGWNGATLLVGWYPTGIDGQRAPHVAELRASDLAVVRTLQLGPWEWAYTPGR